MGHYYESVNGTVEPRHFVPVVSRPGDMRPTRISDVRKMWKEGRTVCPSVTTVMNVLDKPALVNWKVDQHLRVAANVDQRIGVDEWMAEVKRLTELEMDKAPSAGTDIHKELEAWFTGGIVSDSAQGICAAVAVKIAEVTEQGQWNTERNFLHPMGFAGQCDLSGNGWVIDFKSKQTADKFKPGKMAYDEHRMQLAAYRMGLDMPNARAANVFICLEDGEVDFHEHTEAELDKGWKLFQHALAIWQLQHEVTT